MDNHDLRALILKVQDFLSEDDRRHLHFLLDSAGVRRNMRDSPPLHGMESLFDHDKTNEQNLTLLINTLEQINCFDAVKLLKGIFIFFNKFF